MPEDEFRADLRWPVDALGERPPAHLAPGDDAWDTDHEDDDRIAGETTAADLERLADRVLERVRSARTAIEGELAEVRAELAAIRQGLTVLAERPAARQGAGGAADVGRVVTEVAALRASIDAMAGTITSERLDDLADELSGVQAELVALRRRISLRAPGVEGAGLTDDQLERLAAAVAERLRADGRRGSR